MRLKDIGERKAIQRIIDVLEEGGATASGIGDDCAIIDMGEDYLLITTDMINARTHVPSKAKPYQIGWHIIAINLSDIAAKGGHPLGLLVALGLPDDYPTESLDEMIKGMKACAKEFETEIIGGDTKHNEILTLCGTAIGKVPKPEVMRRNGAKAGDVVAVTGELGKAAAGYHALNHYLDSEKGVKALLEPWPRIREGRILAKSGGVSSCIDISDGLAASIHQLSSMSDLAFHIEHERIPMAKEARKISQAVGMELDGLSIYYGGDYELLVTLKEELFNEIKKSIENMGTSLTYIGKVVKGKNNVLIKHGKEEILQNRGFEHFR